MRIRTTKAAALALGLAMHLLGGLTPRLVLCMHPDGDVTIERADRGAIRCDDASTPCIPTGLAATGQDGCHDAAIAQPGLGQRAVGLAAGAMATVMATGVPDDIASRWSGMRLDRAGASPAGTRRTIVLRV